MDLKAKMKGDAQKAFSSEPKVSVSLDNTMDHTIEDTQSMAAETAPDERIGNWNEDNLFPEDWVNVEVTAQQYQPTWGIKEHFEIKDSAIIARTYLSPLSDKETVACQLSDLALAYFHKFQRICQKT